MIDRPVKITFAAVRRSGVRGILVNCSDYRCIHSISISGDAWANDVSLSDIEPRGSSAPPPASVVPTSERISIGTESKPGRMMGYRC